MLTQITLFSSFLFAVIYPLCFLISAHDPLKNKFHQFHLGLPNVVAGVILFFVMIMPFDARVKVAIGIWVLLLIIVSLNEWKKEYPNPLILGFISMLGLIIFGYIYSIIVEPSFTSIISWILGGLVFCSSLYAMNLGHWYLNVHGLPMAHLLRATLVFVWILVLRLAWDVVVICTHPVMLRGELIPILHFLGTMDGFLLGMGIFFGILFPLGTLFFVLEVLRLKNTQSATGILYALLCSVLIGDFTFKFYLIRYGIPL